MSLTTPRCQVPCPPRPIIPRRSLRGGCVAGAVAGSFAGVAAWAPMEGATSAPAVAAAVDARKLRRLIFVGMIVRLYQRAIFAVVFSWHGLPARGVGTPTRRGEAA